MLTESHFIRNPIQQEELARVPESCAPRTGASAVANARAIPTPAATVPYDQEPIDALAAAIGQQGMVEILNTMIDDAPRLLSGLQQALAAYDPAALRLWAHTLKCQAKTVGAIALAQQLQELESIGARGSVSGTATKAARALADYRELMTGLERLAAATVNAGTPPAIADRVTGAPRRAVARRSDPSEQLQVIVAEDNDTDTMLITKNLARGGLKCTMHRVQTESEFVEALERVNPDVIISDYTMPRFDGGRALEIALARSPETPFLFVSGTIGEQRAVDSLRQGATDYILKSNLARLAAAVARALREASVKCAQRQSEQQLRATIETCQDWIWEIDADGKFRFCSPASAKILGFSPESLIGQDFRAYLIEAEHPQSDALLPAPGQLQLTGAVARWRTADGQIRWLERNVVAILDESQQIVGYRGTDRDITARREQEARLRRLTRTYHMLSSTSSANLRLRNRGELLQEACRIAVRQGGYERVVIGLIDPNKQTLRRHAFAESDAKALLALDGVDLDGDAELASMAERTIRSAAPTISNDLSLEQLPIVHRKLLLAHGYEALAILPLLVDGSVVGVITVFSDHSGIFDEAEVAVLEELAANLGFALQFLAKDEAVHFLSYFDGLTGLAKRPLFCQRLAQSIGADPAEPHPLQVVVFDVQKLGAVNDSFGRYIGDGLIENIAARLKQSYTDPEKLAYLGSGTFAIALPSPGASIDVGAMLKASIGYMFVEPIHIEGQEFRPAIRYGVANCPEDATSAEALVQCAEGSLTAAREDNERYLAYTSIRHRPTSLGLALESRLAGALERNEFLLHYQPKIKLATGRVEGFEALLRWQDTLEGLVPPSTFIPLLERSGAIVEVGAWVLLQAARDIHLWRSTLWPDVRVAVNVSILQLRRSDFVAQVLSCGEESRAPMGLDVELTESMLMQDVDLSMQKLQQLREAGVGVAIDDFGTGYSSLRLLSRLPVNALKIDRSFIQGASESKSGRALVATIISLAQAFDMQTIAEGVESEQQVQMLRAMACDQAQGYFFARPGPASEMPSVVVRLSDSTVPA
jgi:PAS domain S-box-containing protein/diguanylate cyclase (GGDEF)-like protein